MQILLASLPGRSVLLCVNSFSFMANCMLNPAGSLSHVGGRSFTNTVLHKTTAAMLDWILLAQELNI